MPKKKKTATDSDKGGFVRLPVEGILSVHPEFSEVKKQIEKLMGQVESAEERLQDLEIHLNLLTRLLTTLCIEKFGMRIGVLKRIIKRIEKEAIRDSQILHLESLYQLPSTFSNVPDKKNRKSSSNSKDDPWDEIS